MESDSKRGSVGLLHELAQQFRGPDAAAFQRTDHACQRVSGFARHAKAYRTSARRIYQRLDHVPPREIHSL